MRGSRRLGGASRVPLDAAHAHGGRGPRARRRRDLARHRRSGHAAAARSARGDRRQTLHDPTLHVYPTNRGIAQLREAVAAHYARRFGVVLDPEREVLPLLGAKEGLAHLCLAQLDPGDVALVADPGYPVYYGGPALAGGEAIGLPLRAEHGFLPDLDCGRRGRRPPREPAHLRLSEQPDGRGRRPRLLAAARRVGDAARRRDLPRQRLRRADLRRQRGAELPRRGGRREAGIEIYSLSKSL